MNIDREESQEVASSSHVANKDSMTPNPGLPGSRPRGEQPARTGLPPCLWTGRKPPSSFRPPRYCFRPVRATELDRYSHVPSFTGKCGRDIDEAKAQDGGR